MTHVLIATDLFPLIGLGLFVVFVIFALGRAASTGQLTRRHRRNFWDRDDSNLSIFGQTGLLDHMADSTTSSSQDDLSIFRSHDNVSSPFESGTDTSSSESDKISNLTDWSSGGSFGNSGGGLGDTIGDLFGNSGSGFRGGGGGGLGESLGSSFGDSGSSFGDGGGGGLGDSLGSSFGESSGGLGDSLSSFGDSGSSFDDNSSGGSFSNDN